MYASVGVCERLRARIHIVLLARSVQQFLCKEEFLYLIRLFFCALGKLGCYFLQKHDCFPEFSAHIKSYRDEISRKISEIPLKNDQEMVF